MKNILFIIALVLGAQGCARSHQMVIVSVDAKAHTGDDAYAPGDLRGRLEYRVETPPSQWR